MHAVQISMGDEFPIKLICASDGTVAFVRQWDFNLIVDNAPDGISGVFDNNGFSLKEATDSWDNMLDFRYNVYYQYKQMPVLTAWLKQQNLVSPFAHEEEEKED